MKYFLDAADAAARAAIVDAQRATDAAATRVWLDAAERAVARAAEAVSLLKS